jgi:hypothetical protein
MSATTLFAIRFVIFVGSANMMKMVFLNTARRARMEIFAMVWDIVMSLNAVCMNRNHNMLLSILWRAVDTISLKSAKRCFITANYDWEDRYVFN